MNHFYAWCPDYGQSEDDARAISAHRPEDAACEWGEAEDCDSADYRIVKGYDVTVLVRDKESGVMTEWVVTGEAVPTYYARRVMPT